MYDSLSYLYGAALIAFYYSEVLNVANICILLCFQNPKLASSLTIVTRLCFV